MYHYSLPIILLSLITYSTFAVVEDLKPKGLDSYTRKELELLPKLRDRVKDGLTLQYMFENKYLVRFLRAGHWDIDDAEKRLRENFQWRKQNQVDSVTFSNFSTSKLARTFPFFFTWDREQRATIVSSLKDLNVRQVIFNGGQHQARRYIMFVIERSIWNMHLTVNRTGIEMIGGNLLFNMAGFNVRNQACVTCLPLWAEAIETYEKYYPLIGTGVIIINVPAIFHRFFQLFKPLVSAPSLKAIELYSVDKSEWAPRLLKKFDKEKLTLEFGGTAPPQKLYRLTREHLTIMLGPQAKTELLDYQ